MNHKVEPLVRGLCPICNKVIMTKDKSAYCNGGIEFWVKFSDESKAQFAMCSDCLDKITQEQLNELMERQKVSWGEEISATFRWFYKEVCHLKIVKWGRTKEEL